MTPVQGVDLTFWYILGISIVLLFGITVVMVWFVIKYRRSKNPVASDIRDNYLLEIIWTVVPTLIALYDVLRWLAVLSGTADGSQRRYGNRGHRRSSFRGFLFIRTTKNRE